MIDDTQKFADIIKENKRKDNEEDVSYDIVSLFTSIPIKETNYICDEIYVNKKLEPFCKKRLIFQNLLHRLATNCVFSAYGNLYKQTDGCTMGGLMSVVLGNIFMSKLEKDTVSPMKRMLYRRYVDDIYLRRIRNQPDLLYENLNKYHKNIKFTIEVNPTRFLDTKINFDENQTVSTEVYRKTNSLPIHRSSKTPKRYKRNTINTEMHRAK